MSTLSHRAKWRDTVVCTTFPPPARPVAMLLLRLSPLMTTRGQVTGSLEELGQRIGLPPAKVDRDLAAALDAGWLRVTEREGEPPHLHRPPIRAAASPRASPSASPPTKASTL